jgi:hypothetical protein
LEAWRCLLLPVLLAMLRPQPLLLMLGLRASGPLLLALAQLLLLWREGQ